MVLSFVLAATAAAGSITVNPKTADAQTASDYRNVAYYASWAAYAREFPLTRMDFTKVTHLNFAFANLNTDGSVVVGDEWVDTQITSGVYGDMGFNWEDAEAGRAGHFGALQKIKEQYPHLKTLISVGGWTWSKNFSDVAADPAKRAVMVSTGIAFIEKYGFDGIDLDWEYPVEGGDNITHRAEDGENYLQLLKELRAALDQLEAENGQEYYLTIAAGANPSYAANCPVAEMSQYLDWINLMTYDYHGGFDPQTNFNAPLYLDPNDTTGTTFSIDASVTAFINAGVSPEKMNLGLPYYGRGWINVDATGDTCLYHAGSSTTAAGLDSGTWEGCSFDYWDIKENYLNQRGYVRYWNDAAKCPYLYSEQTKTFITYDDTESLEYKIDYMKEKGLGGVMYWETSGDKYNELLDFTAEQLSLAFEEDGGDTPESTEEATEEQPEITTEAVTEESTEEAAESSSQESENTPSQDTDTVRDNGLPQHILTGYWQNFDNGAACLKISDVPAAYDIIAVAFAEATSTSGEITFQLDSTLCSKLGGYTKAEFISDIAAAQAKGQKVILSIGGEVGNVTISDDASANAFADSLYALMTEYGFDGVDIDLEHGINAAYIEKALRQVYAKVGSSMVITMAPQTIDMQNTTYEYFKLALNIRDILTIVNTQYYNSGSMLGADGKVYYQGSVDFLTALADIQLQSALRPDQVGLGVPASVNGAGSGYVSNDIVISAVNCLATGSKGGSYVPADIYPTFGGVMTWSINWDASNGYSFANAVSGALDALPDGEIVVDPVESTEASSEASSESTEESTVESSAEAVSGTWNADTVYVQGDRVTYNGNIYEAKWWTRGDNPETQGEWGPWALIGPEESPEESSEESSAESSEESKEESSEEENQTPVTAPVKVTGLKAVYENGQIKLTWDDKGAAKYRVMRFDGINDGYTTLTYSASAEGYVDEDLIDVHRYFYRVCGYFYDAEGKLVQGGVSDSVGIVATDRDPAKVENVNASVSGQNVTLTWDRPEGVRYYKIARAYGATPAEGSYACLKYNVEETAYTDAGVSAGTWRYKVVGYYKAVDGGWVYGDMSTTLFVTVK